MAFDDEEISRFICSENAELKQKLAYIIRKRDEVQRQLDSLLKEGSAETKKCLKPASKVAAVQTDPKPWVFLHRKQERQLKTTHKETTPADIKQINKVLEMHSQLLKRYDKEVKLNMTYADTVSDLNIKLAETERQLREEKVKSLELERELRIKDKMRQCAEVEDPVLRDVVQERNKLAKENRKLQEELKSFDPNFFDELEDLKYALLQSSKLNIHYERSLRKLCTQFGVPFPTPGRVTGKVKT